MLKEILRPDLERNTVSSSCDLQIVRSSRCNDLVVSYNAEYLLLHLLFDIA